MIRSEHPRSLTAPSPLKALLADGWYARSTHRESRMTDTTTDTPTPTATSASASAPDAPEASGFDPQRRATELAILDALRAVVDPEIG